MRQNFYSINILVAMAMERKNLKIFINLLLQNCWAESYKTSPEASVGQEEQVIRDRFDSIIILVAMATERNNL